MPGAVSEGRASRGSDSTKDGGLRERLDLCCERGILGLVLAILVWSPLAMASVRVIDFLAVQGMTALALGLWVVRFWTQRPFRLFWPPLCWAVYAFVVYAVARCRIVDIPYLAYREMMQVIVYGALFLVIANNLNRRESAEIVTLALMGLGLVLSLFAIYQFSTHSPVVSWLSWAHRPDAYLRRGSGTFYNPNSFGGYLGMIIPLALAYVLVSRMGVVAKVVLAYVGVMMVAGLCMTVSRGAIVATGVACGLLCLALLFQGTHLLASILALVALGAGVLGAQQMESVSRRFEHEGAVSKNDRSYYWKIALDVFREDEVWGGGPAQLDQKFYRYRTPHLPVAMKYAHNEYLNTLADWGTVGLAVIVGALGLLFYGGWRSWWSVRRFSDVGSRRSDKGAFVLGAVFGLVAAAIHCAVDFDMHMPADALLAVALMALLAAHQRFSTESHWKNPGDGGRILLMLAGVGVVIFLLADGWHRGREQLWIERANAAKRVLDVPVDPNAPNYDALVYSPERQAAFAARTEDLKRAYAIDPTDEQACYGVGAQYWGLAAQGDSGYQQKTFEAMQWYSRAIMDNPLDALAWLQYGMCLDWLDRHQEADKYFRRARFLDPNGWYVAFWLGKHLMDMDKLTEAREHFMEAYVWTIGDQRCYKYVALVDEKIAQQGKK